MNTKELAHDSVSTKPYFVYMLRCNNGALYCGIALDVEARVHEHNTTVSKASRYVWAHRPVALVYTEKFADRAEASKKEVMIKRMTKQQKEELVRIFTTKKST